ncbi:MAG: transcriptional repressor NrdR [Holophaga sp.]|nr:transcriptional repressor NrdR [Holophaga sp.]
MHCPFCGHLEDKVVDSRESREGDAIRRRRECLACGRRFTSYERVEEVPILIVKKDGRREPFDRQKLLRGMMASCQKRPVSLAQLEEAAGDIQAKLLEQPDREISSRSLGDLVMDALKQLDSVAYVRFASIYRDFKDLPDFVKALDGLMANQGAMVAAPSAPTPAPVVPLTKAPFTAHPAAPPPLSPTPLFPGVAPARVGPTKRRKGR